jgi:oxygen-independent coproporphyrinogen-3 oxidase
LTIAVSQVPLTLYVHLPWCVQKCPYCDFNSHAAPDQLPEDRYIDALLVDLELDVSLTVNRPVSAIFFGGGTPSLFSPGAIERFLAGVRERALCAADVEITLEANPGSIERGDFTAYRAAGINRVSLGAQSFSHSHLQRLGRIHGVADIAQAVADLRQAGIENFNLDLMYGLPEQTAAQAAADITQALELGPTHISHYQLTLEPGTVFYHRPPPLPDSEASWEMQMECQQLLQGAGFLQYEVSAYAQPGRACHHNLNYWEFGDYIGVGAGAHGKLTLHESASREPGQSAVLRTERARQPRDYLARPPTARVVQRQILSAELPFEFMLNALRLKEGFSDSLFEERAGLSLATIGTALADLERRKLLVRTDAGWVPSELGFRFLNDLQAAFL